MAVEQTGSTLVFNNFGQGNTGTVSSTITVPSDADFVLVGISAYIFASNHFTGGGMTFTKGGVDTAMTAVVGADSQNGLTQAPMFWMQLPDTGTNKSLKWDWAGSASIDSVTQICSVRFYKNVDSVRDSDGVQNFPINNAGGTVTVTVQADDLVVGWVGAFNDGGGAEGSVNSFQNIGNIENLTHQSDFDAAWGEGTAVSTASLPVRVTGETNLDDGGLSVIVLVPTPDSITVESTSTLTQGFRAGSTFTAPSGIEDDDVLVVCLYTGDGSLLPPVDVTPPSGWIEVDNSPSAWYKNDPYTIAAHIYYKVASGESGNYTFNHSGADTEGFCYRLSGVKTSNPIDVAAAVEHDDSTGGLDNGTNGNITTYPSITTVSDGAFVIGMESLWDSTSSVAVSSGDPTLTIRHQGTYAVFVDGTQTTAGATGTRTRSLNGNGSTDVSRWASIIVAFRPVSAPDPDVLTASNLTNSAPVIGAPAMNTQTFTLTAANLTNTSPVLGPLNFAKSQPIFTYLGVSSVVEVATTSHALVTTGLTLQQGDLLIACIGSRIASTTAMTLPTGGEWTLIEDELTNNVVAGATTGIASGTMAYCIRGASNPNLTFTHPVAPSVARGQIIAYRPTNSALPVKDTQQSNTTATNTTSINTTGLTTAQINELIVRMLVSARNTSFSAFDAATSPATASITGSQTGNPASDTWLERADAGSATGADVSLAIADGIKPAAGATGNLTATAAAGSGNASITVAFYLRTPVISAGLTNTAPSLGAPALTQKFTLTAAALTNTAPVLGAPALTENVAGQTFVASSNNSRGHDARPESGGRSVSQSYDAGSEAEDRIAFAFFFVDGDAPGSATDPIFHVTGEADVPGQIVGSAAGGGSYIAWAKIPEGGPITIDVAVPSGFGIYMEAMFFLYGGSDQQFDVAGNASTGSSVNIDRDDGGTTIGWMLANSVTGWTGTSPTLDSVFNNTIFTSRRIEVGVDLDTVADTNTTITYNTAQRVLALSLAAPSTADDLTASNLTNTSPVLGAPALAQTGSFTAVALTNTSPVLGAPALGKVLNAAALTNTAPTLGAPALGKVLSAAALTNTAPTLGPATIKQIHLLASSALTNTAPTLGPATIKQIHLLAAAALTNTAPALGAPAIGQRHVLAAASLTNTAPVLGPASLAEAGAILPAPLANTSPVLGPATIGQKHVLGAASLTNSAPVLGAAVYGRVLAAASLTPSSPVLGPASIGQRHVLAAAGLTNTAPDLPVPSIGVVGVMACAPLTNSAPVIGSPPIGQIHVLGAAPLVNSSPALGTPALVGNVSLSPTGLTNTAPVLGPATIGQRHVLTGSSLTNTAPDLGDPQIVPGGVMAALKLTNSSPLLGTPVFGERYSLVAAPLANDSPVLGPARVPAYLVAANFVNGVPTIPGARLNPRYWTKPVSLQGRLNSSAVLSGKVNGPTNLAGKIDQSTDLEGGWQ